jgi:hypothetical protein
LLFGDQAARNPLFGLINQAGPVIIVGYMRFPWSVVALVACPFDIATVHYGMDFIFSLFGILIPPTEHNAHGT